MAAYYPLSLYLPLSLPLLILLLQTRVVVEQITIFSVSLTQTTGRGERISKQKQPGKDHQMFPGATFGSSTPSNDVSSPTSRPSTLRTSMDILLDSLNAAKRNQPPSGAAFSSSATPAAAASFAGRKPPEGGSTTFFSGAPYSTTAGPGPSSTAAAAAAGTRGGGPQTGTGSPPPPARSPPLSSFGSSNARTTSGSSGLFQRSPAQRAREAELAKKLAEYHQYMERRNRNLNRTEAASHSPPPPSSFPQGMRSTKPRVPESDSDELSNTTTSSNGDGEMEMEMTSGTSATTDDDTNSLDKNEEEKNMFNTAQQKGFNYQNLFGSGGGGSHRGHVRARHTAGAEEEEDKDDATSHYTTSSEREGEEEEEGHRTAAAGATAAQAQSKKKDKDDDDDDDDDAFLKYLNERWSFRPSTTTGGSSGQRPPARTFGFSSSTTAPSSSGGAVPSPPPRTAPATSTAYVHTRAGSAGGSSTIRASVARPSSSAAPPPQQQAKQPFFSAAARPSSSRRPPFMNVNAHRHHSEADHDSDEDAETDHTPISSSADEESVTASDKDEDEDEDEDEHHPRNPVEAASSAETSPSPSADARSKREYFARMLRSDSENETSSAAEVDEEEDEAALEHMDDYPDTDETDEEDEEDEESAEARRQRWFVKHRARIMLSQLKGDLPTPKNPNDSGTGSAAASESAGVGLPARLARLPALRSEPGMDADGSTTTSNRLNSTNGAEAAAEAASPPISFDDLDVCYKLLEGCLSTAQHLFDISPYVSAARLDLPHRKEQEALAARRDQLLRQEQALRAHPPSDVAPLDEVQKRSTFTALQRSMLEVAQPLLSQFSLLHEHRKFLEGKAQLLAQRKAALHAKKHELESVEMQERVTTSTVAGVQRHLSDLEARYNRLSAEQQRLQNEVRNVSEKDSWLFESVEGWREELKRLEAEQDKEEQQHEALRNALLATTEECAAISKVSVPAAMRQPPAPPASLQGLQQQQQQQQGQWMKSSAIAGMLCRRSWLSYKCRSTIYIYIYIYIYRLQDVVIWSLDGVDGSAKCRIRLWMPTVFLFFLHTVETGLDWTAPEALALHPFLLFSCSSSPVYIYIYIYTLRSLPSPPFIIERTASEVDVYTSRGQRTQKFENLFTGMTAKYYYYYFLSSVSTAIRDALTFILLVLEKRVKGPPPPYYESKALVQISFKRCLGLLHTDVEMESNIRVDHNVSHLACLSFSPFLSVRILLLFLYIYIFYIFIFSNSRNNIKNRPVTREQQRNAKGHKFSIAGLFFVVVVFL
eukprot:gene11650-8033_t